MGRASRENRKSLSFADASLGASDEVNLTLQRWQPAGKIQKSQPQQTDRQLPVVPARSRWPYQGKPAHILWLAMDHTAAPRLFFCGCSSRVKTKGTRKM
jgi:hypothetical protein